jgi:hypothetical protein
MNLKNALSAILLSLVILFSVSQTASAQPANCGQYQTGTPPNCLDLQTPLTYAETHQLLHDYAVKASALAITTVVTVIVLYGFRYRGINT